MKIFALNLSLEFQWTQPQQRYYFEPISWSQLLQEMENGQARQRQFYVRIEPSEPQLKALFALQADESWRQTHSNLVLILPDPEAAQGFAQNFQRLFIPKLAAGGLVRSEEGSYCCIHNRGCWTLPKGHVDPGETIEAAAIREVQEETGLQEVRLLDKIGETLHTFQRKSQWTLKATHWYRMIASANQALIPQADEEIDAVAWKSKSEWLAVAQHSYPLIREIFEAEFARNL